jgi:hypothetical protein
VGPAGGRFSNRTRGGRGVGSGGPAGVVGPQSQLGREAGWAATRPTAGRGEGGRGGWLGRAGQLGHARGEGAGWAKKGRREGERKEKDFPFSKVYFIDECFHNFNQSKINVWFGMVQQTKIKYFRFLLYTRSQAESRYNFGKDQCLARVKGRKKRVTPEFGEWRKEKIQLPKFGALHLLREKP